MTELVHSWLYSVQTDRMVNLVISGKILSFLVKFNRPVIFDGYFFFWILFDYVWLPLIRFSCFRSILVNLFVILFGDVGFRSCLV